MYLYIGRTRNTTEWLFLTFYNDECEFAPLIMYLGHECTTDSIVFSIL